jgi:hypothetical protein
MKTALTLLLPLAMSCSVAPSVSSTSGGISPPGRTFVGDTVNCETDADCSGDICNTAGHICMHACTVASDCPSTEPTCARVGTSTSTPVCQCISASASNSCSTAAVCNPIDLLCEPPCTQNSDCAGFVQARVCIGAICVSPSDVVDSGPSSMNCNLACDEGLVCDPSTGSCAPPAGATNACPNVVATPMQDPNSPRIWDVVADGNTRQDPGCTFDGGPGTVVEFRGYYLAEGSGTVPQGGSSDESGVYRQIEWFSPSGPAPIAPNTYGRVKITTNVFSFELCNPNPQVEAGVALLDADGDISNVTCLPGE